MKKIHLIIPVFFLFLSGCSSFKSKLSQYYLSKAEKISVENLLGGGNLKKAYIYIGKSLRYNPSSAKALCALDELTDSAYRSGYSQALEMEMDVLKKHIKNSPYDWNAHVLIINAASLRGDVFFLGTLIKDLRLKAESFKGKSDYFPANLSLGSCYGAIIPWIESEGYLNINRSAAGLIEKTEEYSDLTDKFYETDRLIKKLISKDKSLVKRVSPSLLSSYNIAADDIIKNNDEILRIKSIADKISVNKQFAKAVKMTVEGNIHLMKKEFPKARAMYSGAVGNYPGFIDAKKQIVEVDFQQGALIAIEGVRKKAATQLLYKAYEEADDVIELADSGNYMPFVPKNKFVAEIYSLKAAIISAIGTLGNKKAADKMALEREFAYYLDEAIKYNPENSLARNLLDRYAREGF